MEPTNPTLFLGVILYGWITIGGAEILLIIYAFIKSPHHFIRRRGESKKAWQQWKRMNTVPLWWGRASSALILLGMFVGLFFTALIGFVLPPIGIILFIIFGMLSQFAALDVRTYWILRKN